MEPFQCHGRVAGSSVTQLGAGVSVCVRGGGNSGEIVLPVGESVATTLVSR